MNQISKRQLKEKIHQATIEKLSHDGRGIARIEGKTTFIRGALPHEVVQFRYSRIKKDFDEGEMLTLLSESPHRVNPHCTHYAICGGCSLQHLNTDNQIEEKNIFLMELLKKMGQAEPEQILPPLRSKPWHYRHKARLSVRYLERTKKCFVGFREKQNPRFIIALQECSILHEKVNDYLPALGELIASFDKPQDIAQVEVAAGDKDFALIFRHLSPLSFADQDKLQAFGSQTGFRLFLQPGGMDTIHIVYPPEASVYLEYALPEQDIIFDFHPSDFTQVNSDLNRKMIEQVLGLISLKPDDRVLDLFCGLGNFSLPIAKKAGSVHGIEGSEHMVARAYHNAKKNGLTNVEFSCQNLDEAEGLSHFKANAFTTVLLDPPRSGAQEVVKQMQRLAPERIIYISCNPATLARDTQILVHSQGYRLMAAGVMDMFPHTAHVESIAWYQKNT